MTIFAGLDVSDKATLAYDPALRLSQVVGAATTRFLYDGADAIAEYNGTGALQRRFVFDPTTSQPVLWYEGTGTAATNRRYLSQDERGSVISVSGSTGASLGLNTYDEYGKPGASNLGRYQYTGQKWIGEAGFYDYKARDYVPQLGVFTQSDPAGYGDSPNLYTYVLGDPVNLIDPTGMSPMWCSVGDSPWGICTGYASSVIENWLTWRDPPGSRATDDRPLGPGGGGRGGVKRSGRSDSAQAKPEQCQGTRVNYSYGFSGTAALLLGVNLGASVNIGVPDKFSWRNPLIGIQISFSGQAGVMAGYGAFVGAGEQHSVGVSSGPAVTGVSSSYFGEFDAGAGEAIGGAVQANKPLGTGATGAVGGRVGVGAGLYAGAGKMGTATYALRPIGC